MYVILRTTGEYSIRCTEAVCWSHDLKRAEKLADELNAAGGGHYEVSELLPHASDLEVIDGILYIHKVAQP